MAQYEGELEFTAELKYILTEYLGIPEEALDEMGFARAEVELMDWPTFIFVDADEQEE